MTYQLPNVSELMEQLKAEAALRRVRSINDATTKEWDAVSRKQIQRHADDRQSTHTIPPARG